MTPDDEDYDIRVASEQDEEPDTPTDYWPHQEDIDI